MVAAWVVGYDCAVSFGDSVSFDFDCGGLGAVTWKASRNFWLVMRGLGACCEAFGGVLGEPVGGSPYAASAYDGGGSVAR